jgi:hypothetical protein
MFRFAHAEQQQDDCEKAGDYRDPEYRAEIICPQQHEDDGKQRTKESTDSVQRLPQAEGSAAYLGRGNVCQQRVARRTANALAGAVDQARDEHHAGTGCKRKQRLG